MAKNKGLAKLQKRNRCVKTEQAKVLSHVTGGKQVREASRGAARRIAENVCNAKMGWKVGAPKRKRTSKSGMTRAQRKAFNRVAKEGHEMMQSMLYRTPRHRMAPPPPPMPEGPAFPQF